MSALQGKTVVFTGTLKMKRAEATSKATNAGANVTGSISGKTDIVIVGGTAGSTKVDAAKAKGTTVWTEEEFLAQLEGGAPAAPAPAAKGKAQRPVAAAEPAAAPVKKAARTEKVPVAAAAKTAPTAVDVALNKKLLAAAGKGELSKCVKYIKEGVDVNCRNREQWTPLHECARHVNKRAPEGFVAVCKLLLENGADPNLVEKNRSVALHMAGFPGNVEVNALLLDGGASINAQDVSGRTPLHIAAFASQPALVSLLLARGADATIKTHGEGGETPLQHAVSCGRAEVIPILEEHEAKRR